jgi:hypothetical protein
MGFKDNNGQLIPHVKVVWYIWNTSSVLVPPLPATIEITNLILITHTGNYSIEYHGRSLVLIDVISFESRTNSTGWATLQYIAMNSCVFDYLIWGSYYSSIAHLPTSGFCP